MKKVIRSAFVAILLVACSFVVVGCGGPDEPVGPGVESSGGSTETPTTGPDPSPGGAATVWTMVTLVDETPVFGKLSDGAMPGFLILEDAYFVASSDTDDVNLLRRFGGEMHKPHPILIIPESSVLYQEPLAPESKALEAILGFAESNPASATPDAYVPTGSLQAVFLNSGEVFFGSVAFAENALVVSDVYFLRYRDGSVASGGQITSLDQVELVPRQQTAAGTTGEMTIPIASVLYVQTLMDDSPVVEALR